MNHRACFRIANVQMAIIHNAFIENASILSAFVLSAFVLVNLVATAAGDDEWNQFRGSNSGGIYVGKPVPIKLDPDENELWRIDLPKGHSSPVIHGDLLFLTGYQEDPKTLETICISRSSGKIKWRKKLVVDQFEKGHPSFNPASSTPVTDGERVVSYFGSYGLVCYDVSGNKLWDLKMRLTKSYAGNATSPMIVDDKVVLYRGNVVDHFVLALDKKTGKQIWKVPQEEPFAIELACTSCPIVLDDQLILHTARSVQSLNLKDGKQNWVVKCATTATSTPVISKNRVIVAAWNKMGEPALRPSFPTFENLIKDHDADKNGWISQKEYPTLWIFHRPEGIEAPENGATLRFRSADKNRDGKLTAEEWKVQLQRMEAYRSGYQKHGMLSIPVASKGLIRQNQVRTLAEQGIPEVPSPIAKDGILYFVKNGGKLTCIDLVNNKPLYRKRIYGKGTYYASPVIANNALYAFAGDGKYSVIALGKSGTILAKGDLKERVYATPAIADGVIYVRTHDRLLAFNIQK